MQDLRLVSVKGVLFLTPACRRKAHLICSGRSQRGRGCGKQIINIHDLLHLDGPFASGHTAGQSSSHCSVPPNQAFSLSFSLICYLTLSHFLLLSYFQLVSLIAALCPTNQCMPFCGSPPSTLCGKNALPAFLRRWCILANGL